MLMNWERQNSGVEIHEDMFKDREIHPVVGNGKIENFRIMTEDGRFLFLVGVVGIREGVRMGEYVEVDQKEFWVTYVDGFYDDARQNQIDIIEKAGGIVLENGDPDRFLGIRK